MNTFSDWLQEQLDADQIRELAEYGASAGWPRLTHTRDLVDLYKQFEEELWKALAEDAEDLGHASVATFVATFQQADLANTPNGFKSLIVWYMAERTAQRLTDELEDEEDAA